MASYVFAISIIWASALKFSSSECTAGIPGVPGLNGDKGLPGPRGPQGLPGRDGLPGMPGDVGLPGSTCTEGMPGLPGAPGAMGFKGERGYVGPMGPPGLPGVEGACNIKGQKGELVTVPGPPGQKGASGRPGLPGPDGYPGIMGEKGDRGGDGLPGIKGEPCRQGRRRRSAQDLPQVSMVVVHSQNSLTPRCKAEDTLLWEGFSFLGVSSDENIPEFLEMTSTGSCLQRFSHTPFFTESLGSEMSSYWLAAANNSQDISRCAVCGVSSVPLTIHTATFGSAVCFEGWETLWMGHTFLLHGITGQGLSAACLQRRVTPSAFKCSSRGCSQVEFGTWLTPTNINDGRCVVCVQRTLN